MRAIVINDFGAPPTVSDLPQPKLEAGELLVRVRVSSLNGFDAATAAGMLKGMRAAGRSARTRWAARLHPRLRPRRTRARRRDRDPGDGRPRPDDLDRLATEAAAEQLQVPVTRAYPLDQALQALADFAAGAVGKFAITID